MTPTQIEETALELADATGVSSQLEPEVHAMFSERFRKVLAEKLNAKLVEMAAGPTLRPWRLSDDGQYILSASGGMVAALYDGQQTSRGIPDNRAVSRANGELILRCVNGYDILADALKQLLISASSKDLAGQIMQVLDKAGAL